jgi:dihydropteroate synthase type 2
MPRPPLLGPRLVGIVNITEDSFSDGGRFLDSEAALAHARLLAASGADIVELGAAASNVAASPVPAAEEIRRLEPVIAALAGSLTPLALDTSEPATQRFAVAHGIAYLNDIRGFPDPSVYPDLAAAQCRLVVMHAVASEAPESEGGESEGRARRVDLGPGEVWRRIEEFFTERVARLEAAGIARERLILDPGMGLFLSTRADASLHALTRLDRLKQMFGLPVMVSVSRKSFLGALTGRAAPGERGAATLAAELYAAAHGADFIRTHDPGALRDGLTVMAALAAEAPNDSGTE